MWHILIECLRQGTGNRSYGGGISSKSYRSSYDVLKAVAFKETFQSCGKGIDTRVIVSGIAEQYAPEDMVGKQICILANLAPRKIRGIESKGMILMARQNDGKMRFVTPAETLCNGAEIG